MGTPAAEAERELGRSARRAAPRRTPGEWAPAADRPDPVALLVGQDARREPDLVPIRHGRMAESPLAFYRGAAAVMAADLASMPATGLTTQLCGDAHLSNLGLFASPERRLLFDLNDFDETLAGPFEWDLLRLAASFTVAARTNGHPEASHDDAARTCAQTYREATADLATRSGLEVWYARLDADDLAAQLGAELPADDRARAERAMDKARSRTSLQAFEKLTEEVEGRRRIVRQPPLVVPLADMAPETDPTTLRATVAETFLQYRDSLSDSRRLLLERYDVVDVAHKVVGVGSVGLRAFIALLVDRMTGDPLFLQAKEATRSVLEDHLAASPYDHHGRRVVEGQRLLQAASDLFLGWSTGAHDGRDLYWRQLRDMKGSPRVHAMGPDTLVRYAELCGTALARAHARAGSAVAVAGYLGSGDRYDRSVAAFAHAYADQTEADHAAHLQAIADGTIAAVRDV